MPPSMPWLQQPSHGRSTVIRKDVTAQALTTGTQEKRHESAELAGSSHWSTSSCLGSSGQTPGSSANRPCCASVSFILVPQCPAPLSPRSPISYSQKNHTSDANNSTGCGDVTAGRGRCYFMELFPRGFEFSFLCHGHRRRHASQHYEPHHQRLLPQALPGGLLGTGEAQHTLQSADQQPLHWHHCPLQPWGQKGKQKQQQPPRGAPASTLSPRTDLRAPGQICVCPTARHT